MIKSSVNKILNEIISVLKWMALNWSALITCFRSVHRGTAVAEYRCTLFVKIGVRLSNLAHDHSSISDLDGFLSTIKL